MLKIRNEQHQALGQPVASAFVMSMCAHVRKFFPARAWLLTGHELEQQVRECMNRAGRYQLFSQQDVCRYLGVAGEYGWNFDRDPDLHWMREYLQDASLSSPSARIDLLVRQCIFRQQVAADNQRLRESMKLQERSATGRRRLAIECLMDSLLRGSRNLAQYSLVLNAPWDSGHGAEDAKSWQTQARPLLRSGKRKPHGTSGR